MNLGIIGLGKIGSALIDGIFSIDTQSYMVGALLALDPADLPPVFVPLFKLEIDQMQHPSKSVEDV